MLTVSDILYKTFKPTFHLIIHQKHYHHQYQLLFHANNGYKTPALLSAEERVEYNLTYARCSNDVLVLVISDLMINWSYEYVYKYKQKHRFTLSMFPCIVPLTRIRSMLQSCTRNMWFDDHITYKHNAMHNSAQRLVRKSHDFNWFPERSMNYVLKRCKIGLLRKQLRILASFAC